MYKRYFGRSYKRYLPVFMLSAALFGIGHYFVDGRIDGGSMSGFVTNVIDGDTFDMIVGNRPVRVRLHGLDAPEISQGVAGEFSKVALIKLIEGKTVDIKCAGESYSRVVCSVFREGVDIGAELAARGFVRCDRRYTQRYVSDCRKSDNRGPAYDVVEAWKYRRKA